MYFRLFPIALYAWDTLAKDILILTYVPEQTNLIQFSYFEVPGILVETGKNVL